MIKNKKNSLVETIFKTLYYVFLIGLVCVAILLATSVLPITGNYKIMIVQSGSMQPAIKMGSVVVVKPADEYKIGEVITFGKATKTQTPITHRIYDIKIVGEEPRYITKGDVNNAPDKQEVRLDEIVGKVLFDIPYLGYAVKAARKPSGFLLIIVAPAVIIIYDELRKIFKEIRKKKNKTRQQAIRPALKSPNPHEEELGPRVLDLRKKKKI